MNQAGLEDKIRYLENRLSTLEDIEEIKKLQRIYGYYLDNRMADEIIDLFSDNTEYAEFGGGLYLGKDGVNRLFKRFSGQRQEGTMGLHAIQQAVVNVDPNGETAKGRWRVKWTLAVPIDGELKAMWGQGHYENEYIKEEGTWKFKIFRFSVAGGFVLRHCHRPVKTYRTQSI